MEQFRQGVNNFLQKYVYSEQVVTPERKRLNLYLNGVYKILSWKDPILSWRTLGIIHFIMWIILQLRLRFFSILSILVLLFLLSDIYFEKTSISLDENESSPVRLNKILASGKEFLTNMQYFRKTNPRKFCATFSGFFIFLLILSTNISGFLLAYFLVVGVFLAPLIASKIPPEYLQPVKRTINRLISDEGVLTESELIPVVSEKDLDSLLTDRSQDSVSTSLFSGVFSMPSHLDFEESVDDLDIDPEILTRNTKDGEIAGDFSSDSDSEHKGITFESAHFSGDSSSEEEEKYMVGLKFSEDTMDLPENSSCTATKTPASELGLFSNIIAAGQNLISNAIVSKSEKSKKRRDSDSDYEFVNSEDIE